MKKIKLSENFRIEIDWAEIGFFFVVVRKSFNDRNKSENANKRPKGLLVD